MQASSSHTGIQFPLNKHNVRSTTAVGKAIFAASYQYADRAHAAKLLSEKTWRKNYATYMPQMTATAAQSHAMSEAIAEQGLKACYEQFEFHRNGNVYGLKQAMTLFDQALFHTAKIEGKGSSFNQPVAIEHKGKKLQGESLKQQIRQWLDNGIIELGHAQDVQTILADTNAQDLSAHTFVLMGATSEIGPLSVLLQMGANIIAISRPKVESTD